MNGNASIRSTLLFVLIPLSGCAIYEAAGLANEIEQMRRNLPTEMVWMNDWNKETWKRGHGAATLNRDVVEYVRPPETVQNWTEMLTMIVEWKTTKVYSYSGGITFSEVPSPSVMMEAIKVSNQVNCAQPPAFQLLDEDKIGYYPSVTFYLACSQYKSPSPSVAEAQVYKVLQGKHGRHTLIRARRAASLDKGTQSEWAQYLKQFYLCDKRVSGQECGKK
jgi:hypothetical protein